MDARQCLLLKRLNQLEERIKGLDINTELYSLLKKERKPDRFCNTPSHQNLQFIPILKAESESPAVFFLRARKDE